MHRFRQAIRCFTGCLLLGLVGCAVESPRPVLIRSIFVEEPSGAPSPDLSRSAEVVHDTAVRALMARGYVATMEPAAADARVRFAWFARPLGVARPKGRVSLRMVVLAHDGTSLRSIDIFSDEQVGFLTDERIAEHVRAKLGTVDF